MNFNKSILALLFACTLFVGCKESENKKLGTEIAADAEDKKNPNAKPKKIAAANLQTANFAVEGMTCAIGCAKTIQEDLTQLEGVQEATVNFETKQAKVTFDKTIQSPEKLTKVVEAAADGKTYKVKDMKS